MMENNYSSLLLLGFTHVGTKAQYLLYLGGKFMVVWDKKK